LVVNDSAEALCRRGGSKRAFDARTAYSVHSTGQMARHERAFGPLKAGGRRVEWYRYRPSISESAR
jgi:hypothetical protein